MTRPRRVGEILRPDRNRLGRSAGNALLKYGGLWSMLDPANAVTQWSYKQSRTATHYPYSTSADFNTGFSNQKMSFEWWFRPGYTKGNPIRAYFSRGTGTTPATTQFSIGGFQSGGWDGHSVTVGMYDGSAWVFARWRFIYTDVGSRSGDNQSFPPWCHAVVVYDGTLAAADRVKLYLNGTSQPLEITGTIPSQMVNLGGTPEFRVGQSRVYPWAGTALTHYARGHDASDQRSDCAMGPCRVWNRALSAAEAADLNYDEAPGVLSGYPITWDRLSTGLRSGCIAAYDWQQNALDSSGNGNDLLTGGAGPLEYEQAVLWVPDAMSGQRWYPRISRVMPQYAVNGGANSTTLVGALSPDDTFYGRCPSLQTGPNGHKIIRCDFSQHLVQSLEIGFCATPTDEWFTCWTADEIGSGKDSAESFGLNGGHAWTTDDTIYNALFNAPLTSPTRYRLSTRWRDGRSNPDPETFQDGATVGSSIDGAWHVTKRIRPGGGAVCTVRDNGVDLTMRRIPVDAAPGVVKSFADFPDAYDIDRLAIHSLCQGGNYWMGNKGHYGIQAIFGPKLSTADSAELEAILTDMYT